MSTAPAPIPAHPALIRNHVTVLGPPRAARTLVFVHGFGTDQSAWKDIYPRYLAEYRVVLLDNVGGGNTPPEAFVQHHYLDLRRYVSDLLEVCAALELRQPVLIGHSVGAMICALATIEQPARFARLVMIGASPRYLDDAGYHGGFSAADLNALYSAMRASYAVWADQFAPSVMRNEERPSLARQFASDIKAIPQDRALTVLCAIFQSDHRADMARIRLPTLLVHAQDDAAVPLEVAHYLHKHIAGSRLAILPVSGHLPHISAPEQVLAAIHDFVVA